MSLARSFRVKFGAATLHLQTCSPDVREEKSAAQTKVLKDMLAGGKLSAGQKEELTAVVAATTDGWSLADRSQHGGEARAGHCRASKSVSSK